MINSHRTTLFLNKEKMTRPMEIACSLFLVDLLNGKHRIDDE